MKRGQGTFEYVLLLGGVLLIVVLAIVVLQNTAQQSFQGAGKNQCTARLMTEISCQSSTQADGWNECGAFSNATYSGCGFTNQTGCAGGPLTGNTVYCGAKPVQ
ncbi:class III signal peptide-containing protein [Candidatus Micrarchaeota archaeon]|nr:class III signal peptide-containing protein [Candidatus Micrarchaeota archaeon]